MLPLESMRMHRELSEATVYEFPSQLFCSRLAPWQSAQWARRESVCPLDEALRNLLRPSGTLA